MFLAKGEVLFRQGESGPLFELKSGLLKIVKLHEDGSEVLLNLIVPGEIIPHHSLISPKEYNGTAHALIASEVEVLPAEEWYGKLKQSPEQYEVVAMRLQEKLRMMQQRIDQLTALAPVEKILKLQTWFAAYFPGVDVQDVLKQEEIGQFVGLRRETVNRAMKQLKNIL
ncbi:Crp/Fnr family transcriptional regulator [Fictibacillus aquaticus]|uniref:Crp/Fnr family transcriptional regulator n=1 Tax=Fictibacillus aquaticus TaxID=2021314 RepID=A0A235F7Z8_9BACL|nr:Crp/Fnr family transcriptional regulator [Fictibacillus aquaticus]OYD57329.1 Crp/Fnr family transcriptional regulator [Fictibacillus aquaticus]